MIILNKLIVTFFILFLISSCGTVQKRNNETYTHRIKACMKEFADVGYTADSVIKICESVYRTRK